MSNLIERGAGVLCHISSLPGDYIIGSMGKSAYKFADFLKSARVKYWQILPLTQTGYGDSPYQSVCCNSGNPYFIDLEILRDEGLLKNDEICREKCGRADYGRLYSERYKTLRLAFSRFDRTDKDFTEFKEEGSFCDYALFMTLKESLNLSLDKFPEKYKFRDGESLNKFKREHEDEYEFWLFVQFEFFKQWEKLKKYVNGLGIKIIGDIPLYCAYDSSDVWAAPSLFMLDKDLNPTSVAGVPPDYFSKTGQLWGNPLYDWDEMSKDGYSWWINRVKKASQIYDVIRIDHFRGLDRFYAIPYGEKTAQKGEWLHGPKAGLFQKIREELGEIPIIAEDLGVLDEGVYKLLKDTAFPGMKILQFAFNGDEENDYLPRNIEKNSVTYTGTHDNATGLEFLEGMTEKQFLSFKTQLRAALKSEDVFYPFVTREQTVKALNVCALATKSDLAVLPVQDLLVLGKEARMNVPSTSQGNWQFRLSAIPSRRVAATLRKTIEHFNR